MRVALAGFAQGYYAVNYVRYLNRLRDIDIIAICDLNESDEYILECASISAYKFAEELNVPLLHEFSELLDLSPDAILICCETSGHVELAEAAILRGIHCFVSKPLCFSSKSAEQLFLLMSPTVHLLCGNPLKYEKSVIEMRQAIQSGKIGEVYSLRITVNHLAMTKQAWERDLIKSGGPLGTYGVYLFDLSRWITSISIKELYAIGSNFSTPAISAPDTIKIIGKGRGIHFTLELYSAIMHEYPFIQMEVIGTKGTIIAHNNSYTTLMQTETGNFLGSLRQTNMGIAEMDHFIDCIKGEVNERCSVRDMVYVSKCIEATLESLASNMPISTGLED